MILTFALQPTTSRTHARSQLAQHLAHFDVFETSGTLPWCGGSMTCTGENVCRDDVFDRDVCEGAGGFQYCAGPTMSGNPLVRRCTCGSAGFISCSPCMELDV